MIISLQIYCTCGAYLCGAATPEEADQLMQAFAELHTGEDHAPCGSWHAPLGFGHVMPDQRTGKGISLN